MAETFDGAGAIEVDVNGRRVQRNVDTQTTLQEFLHHALGYRDVRKGCGEGVCGACTVLVDGRPLASCLLLAVQAHHRTVVTAVGLETAGPAHTVRRLHDNLLAHEAFQCGYCAPGMLVSGLHHVRSLGDPDPEAVRRSLAGNLCRCTGYRQIVEAVGATASGVSTPAHEFPREDLRERLDATVRYPTDAPDGLPASAAMLVGRVLWSCHAHALVRSIEVEEAWAVPGVRAVIVAKNIKGDNHSGNSAFRTGQPILVPAGQHVRSRGDALAVVAATSDLAARAALDKIHVDYAPLWPVTDVDDAQASDGIAPFVQRRGDADRAFEGARHDPDLVVVRGDYGVRANDHACMEPEGGHGWWEGDDLVLSVPTQTPHVVRQYVAAAIRHPEEKIHVVAPRMGGSFGKYLMTNLEGLLALLVSRTRQPVRLVLDRDEMLARSPKRHAFRGRYEMVVRRSTREIVALKAELSADAGGYVGVTPTVAALFAVEAAGAYEIPNLKVTARTRLTNNLVGAPMRGYGSQQAAFGIESLIDKAARDVLQVSPADFRLRNLVRTRVDGTGQHVPDLRVRDELTRAITAVLDRLGPEPPAASIPSGWRFGRGLAPVHAKYGYPYGFTDRSVVKLRLEAGGTFVVESDLTDAGTGIAAGLPRLVARRLALARLPRHVVSQAAHDDPTGHLFVHGRRIGRMWQAGWMDGDELFRRIESLQTRGGAWLTGAASAVPWLPGIMSWFNTPVAGTKSRLFPDSVDSYIPRVSGSRSLLMAGRAAESAVEALLTAVSRALGVARSRVEPRAAGLVVSGSPARTLSWEEIARDVVPGGITSIGRWQLPPGQLLNGTNQVGPIDHMNGAHGVDLLVNLATGQVRTLKYVACHDVGTVHDREVIEGQIVGGIVMGYGQAVLEHLRVDEAGRVQTAGLHEYHVASSLDAPQSIEVELMASGTGLGPGGATRLEEANGPGGAKGVGEAAAVAAPCAVANAIYGALGRQLAAVTATPEEIAALAAPR